MEKRCPFVRGADGKHAICSGWCALYLVQRDPKYSQCALSELAYAARRISFALREGGAASRAQRGATQGGDDLPF